MPNTFELVGSQTWTAGSDLSRRTHEQQWTSWPYIDPLLAETAVLALSPRPFGMLLRDMSTVPLNGDQEDAWFHTLRYEFPTPFDPDPENPPLEGDPPTPPTAQTHFEVAKQTKRITRAIGETKYGIQSRMPDFDGGIDFDGERFRGTDIIEPSFSFSETHYFAAIDVDPTYINSIYDLVGKTNDDTFRTYAAGEVLFLGASGSRRDETFWEISFSFALRPNQSMVTIGDTINIDIGGWDHYWEYNEQTIDIGAKAIKAGNIGVYVNQLYFPGDYTALNLGA